LHPGATRSGAGRPLRPAESCRRPACEQRPCMRTRMLEEQAPPCASAPDAGAQHRLPHVGEPAPEHRQLPAPAGAPGGPATRKQPASGLAGAGPPSAGSAPAAAVSSSSAPGAAARAAAATPIRKAKSPPSLSGAGQGCLSPAAAARRGCKGCRCTSHRHHRGESMGGRAFPAVHVLPCPLRWRVHRCGPYVRRRMGGRGCNGSGRPLPP